ncbi:MAG: hypothetical protein S4CHLAM7_09940 [Chlamydiae bacterium]|nr:hypothetical protein [Chlamydiota bacterium]
MEKIPTNNPFNDFEKSFSVEELCHFFKIPLLEENPQSLDHSWHSLPYHYCKKHLILPLKNEAHSCQIVMADPMNMTLRKQLAFILNLSVKVCYCPKEKLISLIEKSFHQSESAASDFIKDLSHQKQSNTSNHESYDLLDDQKEQAPSIRLLNFIIQEAYNQRSSDIHFEPMEDLLRIRYRIDGVLQNRHTVSAQYKSHIITRLKVMSRLDIAEQRRPQDGRIKLTIGKKELQFRVSTIPITSGERIVLRILDNVNSQLQFDELGMDPDTDLLFRKMIRRSEGIILVTGPTGSGKTTTLYSSISEIYQDSLNIMTIEDPIEYNLPNIAQIGVHPKIDLTFSKGLRHILRQDPDVIMIGEIRDLETAQIAIQSSLTGHLVLSTLHTNDAPSSITRLVDMGIEPYLLSSSLVGILAQRLVRKICKHCKQVEVPCEKDLELLDENIDKNLTFYKGEGCSHCFQTGYIGRVGIYELMAIKGEVKKNIADSMDSHQLRSAAKREGLVTLKQQGLRLIKEGKTSLEEILRVALGMQES